MINKFSSSLIMLYIFPAFICGLILFMKYWFGIISIIFILMYYRKLYKKNTVDKNTLQCLFYIIAFINLTLLVSFIISQGSLNSPLFNTFYLSSFPFFMYFFSALLLLQFTICFFLIKPKVSSKKNSSYRYCILINVCY